MAFNAGNIWCCIKGATAANLNGGFFNTENANLMSDGAITSGTGNSPVLTSATYTFVTGSAPTGDVGAWVYIKSNGANTVYKGWYQIASVSGGAATLKAAVGEAVWHNSQGVGTLPWSTSLRTFTVNTTAGVATSGSPSGITFGVDYSQDTSHRVAYTDLVIGAVTTEVTSVAFPFGQNHVGNALNVASGTGFTVQWCEIVSVATITATLDKSAGTTASTGGVGKLGGAMSLEQSSAKTDDSVFENGVAGNDFFVKNGSYTIGGTINIAAAGGTQNPIRIIGFNALRGDAPTGTSRPSFNVAAVAMTTGTNWDVYNLILTGTATSVLTAGAASKMAWVKATNTSPTAGRAAFTISSADALLFACEAVSYRGRGVAASALVHIEACYIHDSDIGILISANGAHTIRRNIIAENVTYGIQNITTAITSEVTFEGNTFHGIRNGSGVNPSTGILFLTGTTDVRVINSIIKGFTTGINHPDVQTVGFDAYNFFYDNTTNATNWPLGIGSSSGTDPGFSDVTHRTGTTATTTAGDHLVQSGATFQTWGIVAGDYVYISGGAGVTAGIYGILSVDSETQITTDITLTANATADKVWSIRQGRDFAIGTALKALAFPGVFPAAKTTSYLDPGSSQRQEVGGSGGTRIY